MGFAGFIMSIVGLVFVFIAFIPFFRLVELVYYTICGSELCFESGWYYSRRKSPAGYYRLNSICSGYNIIHSQADCRAGCYLAFKRGVCIADPPLN